MHVYSYTVILLYKNPIVKTKQELIIDTHKKEKDPNIILKIVIKSQGKRGM